jgi:hypothetical protein
MWAIIEKLRISCMEFQIETAPAAAQKEGDDLAKGEF